MTRIGNAAAAPGEASPDAVSPARPPAVAAAAALASPTPEQAWRQLLAAAQDRYRVCGRFAQSFAGGKLRWDPVFRHLLEHGRIPTAARIVDIGCGQGLLASLLAAVEAAERAGGWPAEWPQPPLDCRYLGIELMRRDAERAERALGSLQPPAQVICGDMLETEFGACDVVVILDVLHYVAHDRQAALLARVFRQLDPGGRLLLRIGDQAERRGFAASQWTDRLITAVRGHRVAPTFCRPVADWLVLLEQLGFGPAHRVPMSQGTPFANVLLIADKP